MHADPRPSSSKARFAGYPWAVRVRGRPPKNQNWLIPSENLTIPTGSSGTGTGTTDDGDAPVEQASSVEMVITIADD